MAKSNRREKILIIGNGFDLAHGLPTAYKDFMRFCKVVPTILLDKKGMSISDAMENADIHSKIKAVIESELNDDTGILKNKTIPMVQELKDCIQENIWYKYFQKIEKDMRGDNWIDFESEISEVIEYLDRKIDRLEKKYKQSDFINDRDPRGKITSFFVTIFSDRIQALSGRDIREICFNDLEKLTRALEIYLSVFVEKIDCDKLNIISEIQPDYVLSFNYTDTYKKVYVIKEEKPEIFHIHGKCNAGNPMKENNMVLGIDEYWEGKDKDIHTNFSIFKKFVQRIRKKTGAGIYTILDAIEYLHRTFSYESTVYVFGHSLDKTDKDILSQLLGHKTTAVKVYCKDKGSEGELIAKMIQLIGQDNLVDKVYADPSKLEFEVIKK